MRDKAAALFDAGQRCGAEANMAKHLASEASWEAANACMDTHGGYGLPWSTISSANSARRDCTCGPGEREPVLSFVAQHVLGIPRSY